MTILTEVQNIDKNIFYDGEYKEIMRLSNIILFFISKLFKPSKVFVSSSKSNLYHTGIWLEHDLLSKQENAASC